MKIIIMLVSVCIFFNLLDHNGISHIVQNDLYILTPIFKKYIYVEYFFSLSQMRTKGFRDFKLLAKCY